MSGYVRIHRALCGHPAFRNDAEAMAFAWMVAKAQWKPKTTRYKGHDITLQRGQLTISIRDFADAMDRPKGWAERLFSRLREHGLITQINGTEVGTKVGTHGGTGHGTPANVITICNYSKYQADSDGRETPSRTPDETAAGQRRDTEQIREEGKKEDTPPNPRKRGNGERSLIPQDWKAPLVSDLPPKARACAEQWTPESYDTEAEAFVCYWRSERKMKADWNGTWANRIIQRHSAIMRDQKFGNAAPTTIKPKGPLTPDELRSAIRYRRDIGDEAKAQEYENELKQRLAA